MQIGFGVPVYGIGDKHLGEVGSIIVNAGTKRARAILIDSGVLGGSKHILEVSAIKSADANGVGTGWGDGLHLEAVSATGGVDVTLGLSAPDLRNSFSGNADDGVRMNLDGWQYVTSAIQNVDAIGNGDEGIEVTAATKSSRISPEWLSRNFRKTASRPAPDSPSPKP